MAYQRGQVVRLIRPITEVRIAEDHGSSVWVSCNGLSGWPRSGAKTEDCEHYMVEE